MTTTELPYILVDGIARNAEHPDTFGIPNRQRVAAVRPGDFVKLSFEFIDPEPEAPAGERMWVEVTTAEAGRYTGTLANHPHWVPLEHGDLIEFTAANIISIEPKETAFTSATTEKPCEIVPIDRHGSDGVTVEWGVHDRGARRISWDGFESPKAAADWAVKNGYQEFTPEELQAAATIAAEYEIGDDVEVAAVARVCRAHGIPLRRAQF